MQEPSRFAYQNHRDHWWPSSGIAPPSVDLCSEQALRLEPTMRWDPSGRFRPPNGFFRHPHLWESHRRGSGPSVGAGEELRLTPGPPFFSFSKFWISGEPLLGGDALGAGRRAQDSPSRRGDSYIQGLGVGSNNGVTRSLRPHVPCGPLRTAFGFHKWETHGTDKKYSPLDEKAPTASAKQEGPPRAARRRRKEGQQGQRVIVVKG